MPHEPDYGKIFSVSAEARDATQRKFGLLSDRRRILFSGRLAAVKGIDTLIDSFIEIAEKRPDWDLLIVGGGQLEQQLRDRVPAALANRVVWAGFVKDRDELSTLYTCADVFVLPSLYEPWAVVVCEAAAAGLAMITSDMVGAGAELCREGVNGGLFPAGDTARLTELLLQITSDPARLQTMRTATLRVLDEWRRRGDPVQGVRLAMAHVGLSDAPPPVEPNPPTPVQLPEIAAPISHRDQP
jgi:glycosyltransferase involved in cell wall biosynthesis